MMKKLQSWTKRVLTGVVCSLMAVGMYAVPARPGWQTRTQADGSTIEVQVIGDEFYHYTINRDGKQVREINGMYIEVGEAPTVEVAKARRAKAVARRAPQAVGTEPNLAPKGVVILANFSDKSMQSSHTQAVFDELCNSTNCTVNSGYPSAAQYFADQSNGAYRPQFDVFGPVTLSRNVAYYGTDKDTGNPDDDEGDDQHATDAVVEACILANQQFTINWADYDSDNDGYVDFVYVIYAGKGQADGGTSETIWPHNWQVSSARYYGYCTYSASQCKLGGKTIENYAMSGELSGSSLSGIGTLCHEFGHVMGLPDLYDTKYGTNYKNHVTPNDWNIMDGGSYNGNGHCPPNYDPWQKQFFGWFFPINLGTEGQDISIKANGTEGAKTYQINSTNKYQGATESGVCYYIENRQKTGWDAALTGHGMLVWKVNFNADKWTNNAPNNTAGDPLHTVVSAYGTKIGWDGSTDNCPWNTFPGTKSVKSYTPISGHAITEITESNGIISFKYNGGNTTTWSYDLEGEHCVVPAGGTVDKGAALHLTITADDGYTLDDPDCWAVEMGSNVLEYGVGFTYDENDGAFTIPSVTGNVFIYAVALAVPVQITWMSNGTKFTTTNATGTITLPENTPEPCDGTVFVGWCADSNYESATTAPTYVLNGDDVTSTTTYYAVFATQGEGGSGEYEKASSIAVGDKVVLVYEKDKKELSGISSTSTKYGEGKAYSTTPAGAYALDVVAGNTSGTFALKHGSDYLQWSSGNSLSTKTSVDANSSWTITFSGGNATIKNAKDSNRSLLWNSTSPRFACYTSGQNAIQIYRQSSGTSYTDYTTHCAAACEGPLTSITLNTENVKKTFTEGEIFTYEGLIVTANYDGCESKVVPPTSVSTPDMATAGDKTVTVSYTENEITKENTYSITVNALPTYAIRFFNNGVQLGETQNVKQGQAATKPVSDPIACDGYTFGGWFTAELAEDNTEKPGYVTDFTATKDQDYYAVYSQTEEGEGGGTTQVEDQLTRATTGVTKGSTTYVNWSGKSVTSDAVYAGNSAGGNDAIQLRSSNSNSGIITTASGGKITKVTVSWNSSTSGRTLDIYGKNTAYSTASDLYGTNKGEKLGSIASDTQTELTISGDYTFVGVRSNSGAMYIDAITFTWGGGASSTTYYTTSPTCEACTAAVTITQGTAEHGSFALNKTGEQSTCGEALIVTVTNIVPAEGYRFKEITQTGIEGAVIDQTAKTVTYPKKSNGASTINVLFDEIPNYVIRFFDNGTKISEQEVDEGESADKPENPTPACSQYTFVGWWTAELAEDNTEAKAWITDFTATQDQDYYAIYSKTAEGGSADFDGETEGKYRIYAQVGDTKYYATATQQSSKLKGSISEEDAAEFTLVKVTDGFNIKLGDVYIGYSSGTNLSFNNAYTWTFAAGTKGTWRVNSKTSGRALLFQAGTANVFGGYATSNVSSTGSYYDLEIVGKGATTYYTSTVNCSETPTELVNMDSQSAAQKILHNGQLLIIRDGKTYNMVGHIVE